MSLFGQEDQDAPELRGGFFRRLRTPRANFVEPSTSSTEPKIKRSRRHAAPASAETQPPLTSATRAPNPQVMFLGRALTGGDIEDVDSTDVVDRVPRARPDAAPDAAEPAGSIEEPAFRSFEPPKFERPSYESLSAAMAAAEQRQAVAGRVRRARRRSVETAISRSPARRMKPKVSHGWRSKSRESK